MKGGAGVARSGEGKEIGWSGSKTGGDGHGYGVVGLDCGSGRRWIGAEDG